VHVHVHAHVIGTCFNVLTLNKDFNTLKKNKKQQIAPIITRKQQEKHWNGQQRERERERESTHGSRDCHTRREQVV
jgi:hypothetical protein